MSQRRSHGEGSIFYEEARDRWVGTIDLGRDGAGKRKRSKVTGRTKSDVKAKIRKLQAQVDAGLPTTDGTLTVGAFLDRWITEVLPARSRVKSSNTLDNYRWAVERHLRPALGAKRLRDLRAEDVEGLLRQMAAAGLSRNSLIRVRSVLVMALKHAQRRDLLARNAAELAELPTEALPPEDGRSLTASEARHLLNVSAVDPLGPLVVVGLMLGLRPGELSALRWDDVDFDSGTVHVRQALKRVRVDGRLSLDMGAPKTPRSRRSLAAPAPVLDALQRQRAQQARDRLAAGPAWQDHDLVFPASNGVPMDPANLRRRFARLTATAGLGHWHPNELRHSAASLLSAAGVPLEQIADLLGHTTTRMLEKHYRHSVRPTVAAAAAPMEGLFGAS